jgi:hypothetical protein
MNQFTFSTHTNKFKQIEAFENLPSNALRKLIRKLGWQLIRKLSKQLGFISPGPGEAAVRLASR